MPSEGADAALPQNLGRRRTHWTLLHYCNLPESEDRERRLWRCVKFVTFNRKVNSIIHRSKLFQFMNIFSLIVFDGNSNKNVKTGYLFLIINCIVCLKSFIRNGNFEKYFLQQCDTISTISTYIHIFDFIFIHSLYIHISKRRNYEKYKFSKHEENDQTLKIQHKITRFEYCDPVNYQIQLKKID